MSYEYRPGSLKLKGGVIDGGVVKKKKKKPKVKSELLSKEQDLNGVDDLVSKSNDREEGASGSDRASSTSSVSSSKTGAEKRFEKTRNERLLDRVAKSAYKTHKDRVNEFNAHLESLSEHHDIPKVGPG